jgi:hypothetical protein
MGNICKTGLIGLLVCLPVLCSIICGCNGRENIREGDILDIKVLLGLQSSLAQGLSFENVSVQAGTLTEPAMNPWQGGQWEAGDRCLRVRGEIKNDTSQELIVSGHAEGYNTQNEQVSFTLSSARIRGQFEFSVPQQSIRSFEFVLSWAKNVQYIEMGVVSLTETQYYGE